MEELTFDTKLLSGEGEIEKEGLRPLSFITPPSHREGGRGMGISTEACQLVRAFPYFHELAMVTPDVTLDNQERPCQTWSWTSLYGRIAAKG
ncbi:MAG: hypothetical protein HW402_916 [Dehalococcoidales bacterium]|nr:hypothetical protein [Dehalococcoidales bacterium]